MRGEGTMRRMMRRLSLAFVAVALAIACAVNGDDLAGLWKAKKRFGPDSRGTLVVSRTANGYTADFLGSIIPVTSANGELMFALPNGDGSFRGRLDERGTIRGHWYRRGTEVNGADRKTPVAASPVRLSTDGANRWRGAVDSGQDTFTFYLLLQPRSDNSFAALLRNPEFDLGTQQRVERLDRNGNSLKLIGKRGGKEQEIADGNYDPEGDVITLRFPSRGGSYDFSRDNDASAFYPRGKNPGRYVYRAPLLRDDGWPVGTLDEARIDRASVERLVQRILDMSMDSPDTPQFHGLLIASHGKLVFEEYFHGEHRDNLHSTRSAGKSLTALVVGAAMQAGAPLKLSTPVYPLFQFESDEQKKTMKVEDLLTMSAGFFCDDTNDDAPGNEETMWNQTAEPDFYRYTLRVPQATPPGENAVYCSAIANLALGAAGRAAHENPMSLFDRLIGDPLKIRRYDWGVDPAGNPYGGGGPSLTLRDFAKLGQLLLNRGMWNGRQIVSREFAKRAGSPLYHLRNIYYGYLWWSEDYPYKNRTVHAFAARGSGGQSVTVIPDLDLVVGTFAGNYSSRKGMFAASNDLVPNSILPTVREPGDDPHAPVVEGHYVTPYGTSKNGSRVQ